MDDGRRAEVCQQKLAPKNSVLSATTSEFDDSSWRAAGNGRVAAKSKNSRARPRAEQKPSQWLDRFTVSLSHAQHQRQNSTKTRQATVKLSLVLMMFCCGCTDDHEDEDGSG